MTDLAIIGAGPAGLAAAVEARSHGLTVTLIDEQPAPGGQIWRGIETAADPARLGTSYAEGRPAVAAARASGATFLAATALWQLDPDGHIHLTDGERASTLQARRILIATGAQERPVPIPGWTLPGVMGVGAAQVLLKSGGIVPSEPVWIAGTGPLPLLYATQLLAAGGRIAGMLDTAMPDAWDRILPHLPAALRGWRQLRQGLDWHATLRRAGIRRIRNVEAVEAKGEGAIQTLRWRAAGRWAEAPCRLLLLHEGVVPNLHLSLSLGLPHLWDTGQMAFRPARDGFGRTDLPSILIAGDCGGIGGARLAAAEGRLAALAAAHDLGQLDAEGLRRAAAPIRSAMRVEAGLRPFLDALFRPRPAIAVPPDDVVLCRCEGVTAGAIRAAVATGAQGPNQTKAFTRAGMGPCQGRMCGLAMATTIAAARGVSPGEVGLARARPPLRPLTLGELAALGRVETV